MRAYWQTFKEQKPRDKLECDEGRNNELTRRDRFLMRFEAAKETYLRSSTRIGKTFSWMHRKNTDIPGHDEYSPERAVYLSLGGYFR
jgi:hypothetical protein